MRGEDSPLLLLPLRLTVQAAIQDLPDNEREIMELILEKIYAGESLNLSEIARQRDCALATNYDGSIRALELMGKALEENPYVKDWMDSHST